MTALINLVPLVLLVFLFFIALKGRGKFMRASRQDAQPPRIENLIPLEAYDADETGYWARMPYVFGIYFGLAMAVWALVSPFPLRYSPPVAAGITFLVAGPFFGVVMRFGSREILRGSIAGLFAGNSKTIDPPPAGLQAYYQIVCTKIDGRRGTLGVVYIGRGGLLFTPKRTLIKKGPAIESFPIQTVALSLAAPPPQNWFQHLLIPRPQMLIEIARSGSKIYIGVPQPASTLAKMSDCIETLRRIPQ